MERETYREGGKGEGGGGRGGTRKRIGKGRSGAKGNVFDRNEKKAMRGDARVKIR